MNRADSSGYLVSVDFHSAGSIWPPKKILADRSEAQVSKATSPDDNFLQQVSEDNGNMEKLMLFQDEFCDEYGELKKSIRKKLRRLPEVSSVICGQSETWMHSGTYGGQTIDILVSCSKKQFLADHPEYDKEPYVITRRKAAGTFQAQVFDGQTIYSKEPNGNVSSGTVGWWAEKNGDVYGLTAFHVLNSGVNGSVYEKNYQDCKNGSLRGKCYTLESVGSDETYCYSTTSDGPSEVQSSHGNGEESNASAEGEDDSTTGAGETAVFATGVFDTLLDVAVVKLKTGRSAKRFKSFQRPPILEEVIGEGIRLDTVLRLVELKTGLKKLSVYQNGAQSSRRGVTRVGKLTFKHLEAYLSANKKLDKDAVIVTGVEPNSRDCNRLEYEPLREVCHQLLEKKCKKTAGKKSEDESKDGADGKDDVNDGDDDSSNREDDASDDDLGVVSKEDFAEYGDSGAVVFLEYVDKDSQIFKIPYAVHRGVVTLEMQERFFIASPLCASKWSNVRQQMLVEGKEIDLEIWNIFVPTITSAP